MLRDRTDDAFIQYLQYPGFKYGEGVTDNVLEKALPKPKSEPKQKTEPGVKAARKQMGVGGKVRYTYPNDRGGTKPQAGQSASSAAKPAVPAQNAPSVSSTEAKADPAKFCSQIGIKQETLQKIVSKFDENLGGVEGFVKFMLTNVKDLAEKYQLNGEFFRILYDEVLKPKSSIQKSMDSKGYYKHVEYKRLDPRTGKIITVKGGKTPGINVAVSKTHTTDDEHMSALHAALKQSKPTTEHSLQQHVHDHVVSNYTGSEKLLANLKSQMLKELFDSGAVAVKDPKAKVSVKTTKTSSQLLTTIDDVLVRLDADDGSIDYADGVFRYDLSGKQPVVNINPQYSKIVQNAELFDIWVKRAVYTAKVADMYKNDVGLHPDSAIDTAVDSIGDELYDLGGVFGSLEKKVKRSLTESYKLSEATKKAYIKHVSAVVLKKPKIPTLYKKKLAKQPAINKPTGPKVPLKDIGGIKHDDHRMLKEWAIASNVSLAALKFRIGAAALMGVKDVKGAVTRVRDSVVKNKPASVSEPYLRLLEDELKPANVKASAAMMKRIAKATQAAYAGSKTVRLYRGVNGEQAAAVLQSMGLNAAKYLNPPKGKDYIATIRNHEKAHRQLHGKTCLIACDTCSSFTDDYETATDFAHGGFVLSVDVPVTSLLASYKAFPGSLSLPSNFVGKKWGTYVKDAYSSEFEVLLGVKGALQASIFHPPLAERQKLKDETLTKEAVWNDKKHIVAGLPRDLSHIYGNNTKADW